MVVRNKPNATMPTGASTVCSFVTQCVGDGATEQKMHDNERMALLARPGSLPQPKRPSSPIFTCRHGTCSIQGENRTGAAAGRRPTGIDYFLLEAVMRISNLITAVTGLITGALALLAAPCALALSLGDADAQSSLGQPLRVIVPIDASKAQSLTAACIHVIADAAGGSGPPRLLTGRVTIDPTAAGPQLLVTTARPVNEPVVRLAVQAGCDGTTRRDYVLLLDPPGAIAATAGVAYRRAETTPVATAAAPRMVKPASNGFVRVATAPSDAAIREAAPKIAPIEPVRQPATMLSSSGGGSFIAEAAAAGLPRSSSSQTGLTTADVELPVAPWWPLAAALLVVGALARWLVPMRRRSLEPPAWVAPTARTEPNPSVSGASTSKTFGKTGHFAAMTEPGPGFPRGAAQAERTAPGAPTTTRSQPRAVKGAATIEDQRFAEFDADLLEEQTIRAEWAKAVSDGAIDIGSDSILKAIDEAERETQGAPAHPAQVALDRSLDDELLPNKRRG
jgi:hypothetical protein